MWLLKEIVIIEKDCSNWKNCYNSKIAVIKKNFIIEKDCDNWKDCNDQKICACNKMNSVVIWMSLLGQF